MGWQWIPLHVILANFYLGVMEECVFFELPVPLIYCRYIDDTFVQVDAEEDLQTLRDAFVANSSLNYIYEKLAFLDIEFKQENSGFHTQV